MKHIPLLAKHSLETFAILAVATGLAFVMRHYSIRTENILLIYIGAVLFVNIETRKLWIGMIAALICVILFNFLFVEPYYTFVIADPNYWISIVIFSFVTITVNTLTSNLQKQIELSLESEKRTELLNRINTQLLNAHSFEEIGSYVQGALADYLKRETILVLKSVDSEFVFPKNSDLVIHREKVDWCVSHHVVCGKDKLTFSDSHFLYFPLKIIGERDYSGVLSLWADGSILSTSDLAFIDAAFASFAIACDRETTSMQKEKANLQVEKEKFKSSLLRSISHDIRTPLTSISTGSSILLDDFDNISSEDRRKMLLDINNESLYLADFVNNLLNMTKIDANKLTVDKHKELIDDILAETYQHVQKRLGTHRLIMPKNVKVLFIDVDRQLIIQVFINLIDNAIVHTPENTKIQITYECMANRIYFHVIDNGGGISPARLEHLFDELQSVKAGKADEHRGTGLGLSISRAIVRAHGGELISENNDMGGATFTFDLPFQETEEIV